MAYAIQTMVKSATSAKPRKNGRKVARAIQADPQRKRLQQIKLMISQSLKHGYCTDEVKEKLRYCAMKRPDLFACWTNL